MVALVTTYTYHWSHCHKFYLHQLTAAPVIKCTGAFGLTYGWEYDPLYICASNSRLTDGWMDGWVDGWVDGWMDGWMGGRMDGWMGIMGDLNS